MEAFLVLVVLVFGKEMKVFLCSRIEKNNVKRRRWNFLWWEKDHENEEGRTNGIWKIDFVWERKILEMRKVFIKEKESQD